MPEQDTSSPNMITGVPEHLEADQPPAEASHTEPELVSKVPDELGGQAVREQATADAEAAAASRAANPTHTVHTTIGKMPPHEPSQL